MAKVWTRADWDDELRRIARDAAKSRMEKKDLTGYSQDKIDAIKNELVRTAKKKLDEEFPFSIKDTDKEAISNWKADDAGNYLLSGANKAYKDTYNPLNIKKQDDFQKLAPLILGVAEEGRDWYNMGQEDLFHIGKTLGYDVSTKKGKMDFLRDVGDVQQAYDRGKLLEEFNSEASLFDELLHPTIMEEARKQISTGRGTKDDLYKAAALDAGINSAMFFAPSVSKVGRLAQMPVRGGVAGALLQGALEGGRQGGKTIIDDDLEANMMAPLLATTMGATRPGMIGTASTLAQQIPTGSANRFARGVAGATRRGNPTYMERDEFGNALDLLLNRQKGAAVPKRPRMKGKSEPLTEGNLADQQAIAILSGPNAATYTLPELANARLAEKALPKIEALYGPEKAKAILNNLVNKERVLEDYDNLANLLINRDRYNAARQLPVGKELVNGELREGDVLTKLEQAFPSKMAEAYGNDKWYKAGLGAGKLLGEVGGRVEPIMKVNPFGPLSGGRINVTGGDEYKETAWYKKLSKKQQEAFDDAYEKARKQAK